MPTRSVMGWPVGTVRFDTARRRARAVSTARTGSSSWAGLAPKVATTASPMNFSTLPSRASISALNSAKTSVIRAPSSSASRRSAMLE